MVAKNIGLTVRNILVAGLPIMLTWDLIVTAWYLGAVALFMALTVWNPVGDYIATLFAIRGEPLPEDALIAPAVNRYLKSAGDRGLLSSEKCAVYYSQSKIPYLLPLSKNLVVVSIALEDWLIQDTNGHMFQVVPEEAYDPIAMLSRRALLLSILCYVAVIRLMELWAIFFAVAIKAIMALLMIITSGAFFDGFREMLNATCWGLALGAIIMKINEWMNYLQDKLVNWLMDATMKNSVTLLEEDAISPRQGGRERRAVQQAEK